MVYLILGLLRGTFLSRWAPVPCANCGQTVDSRAPACWNCKMPFG